jgi:hypothetical protein
MPDDSARRAACDPLAPLYGKYPGWECWRGITGILYARLRKTSPPVVVRAATVEELAGKVAEEQAKRS